MEQRFVDILTCPLTGERLELSDGELCSENTSYPIFNNIPWLFKNPEYSFLEWSTKIEGFIEEEEAYTKHLLALHDLNSKELTKQRFSQIVDAKTFNLEVLKDTLSLFLGHKHIRLMPSKQQIQSYYQLIFRDWVWKTNETKTYLDFITKSVDSFEEKKILVLGAGACGLSYQLATANPTSAIIATDHNPFLFLTANKIINGEQVELFDYSNYPKRLSETSKKYSIKNTKGVANHHQVLSSFPNLPFNKNDFDIIICPWFLDILEIDLDEAFNESIKYLKPDGDFICISPGNKHSNDVTEQLTSSEMNSIFESHFEKSNYENTELNYLENPIESHKRVENIFMFHGKIKKEMGKKSNSNNQKKEIILTPEFAAFKQKIQVYNKILDNINEDMSFNQLAKKLITEFEFSEDEAGFYAETFVRQIKNEL